MLSRLSGLANTVLQELSGEGENAGIESLPAGPELEPSQQNGEEAQEDVSERLADMERLVVQLKDLVREKDAQLQQKDAALQEERQAADAKLAKLKLQAKAKVASLNKRIEELTQRASVSTKDLPEESLLPLPTKLQGDQQETHNKLKEEVEALRRRLQEQEALTGKLQEQLEEATGSLRAAEAQLTRLQGAILEKDALLEEQACRHQAELHQLAAQSTLEAEMQQNLRLLQRKLEEQEAALLGRTQVVELLQQELNSLEEQKQASEAELESLRQTSASDRQQSQTFVEKLEMELAERKLACHHLQEELHQLSQASAQARAAEDAREQERKALEERHLEELEEKSQQIAQLQQAQQDLRSSHDVLLAENRRLQQDLERLQDCSTKQASTQQEELPEGPPELGSSQAEPETSAVPTLELVSTLDKPLNEQDKGPPPKEECQPEDEELKMAGEKLEAGNESLRAQLALLEKQLGSAASYAESSQVADLKSLQQQAGAERAERARLEAQLQEQKQETEPRQHRQEQLREEKAAWEGATKEQLLSPVQTAVRETRPHVPPVELEQRQRQAPLEAGLQLDSSDWEAETNRLQAQLRSSLTELHQKELRIQQLNTKLSQVFEEKNALSLQLRGSSRSLRESQQRYSDALARCEALEKQLQPSGKDVGSLSTDAAPGAPQERSEHPRESYTPELQELQMRLSAARQEESAAKQGLLQLEELLQEEREQHRATEEAFSAAQDHIRRLESSEWARSVETSIDMPPAPEHPLLVGTMDGTFSKPRPSTGPRRFLRSLFCSRTRLPLVATIYLLTVHVLLLLCFTGHL